ncbi:MAG: hypothetical protein RLY31_300 [Bacteroidota bacterium]|jgi:hypothetical protein
MQSLVFILCTEGRDSYPEATATAIQSVRYSNPNLPVQVVTDPRSYRVVKEKHPVLSSLPDNWKVVNGVEGEPRKRSRHLKTSLRRLVDGRCVFLDGDVLVRKSLLSLFELPVDLAAAVNHSTPVRENQVWPSEVRMLNELQWETPAEAYYNTGVLLLNDTEETHRFWEQWHIHWKWSVRRTGRYVDQPAFNHTLVTSPSLRFRELHNAYNAQLFANLRIAWAPVVWHFYTTAANTHRLPYLDYIEQRAGGLPHDPALVAAMCRSKHPWTDRSWAGHFLARRGIRRGYLWPVEEYWLTGRYREAFAWWIRNKYNNLKRFVGQDGRT